jgi:hypothetical protein
MAKYLTRFGKTVFVIDLDLEAPGLNYKLALDKARPFSGIKLGLVDILTYFQDEGKFPDSLSKYILRIDDESNTDGHLTFLPAGNAPDSSYWKKLSRICWHEWFYTSNAKGVPFFLELKEQIKKQFEPDFLLIDSRTGITETGGIALTLLPELVVCLFLNNRENMEGAREVLRSIRKTPRLRNDSKVDILPVLSRIPFLQDSESEKVLIEDMRKYLNEEAADIENTINAREVLALHSEPEIEMKEALRVGGEKSLHDSILLRDYLKLFSHVVPSEILALNVGALIQKVFSSVLDDPDGTESALEQLAASYPHPDIYRALLKFYRLRKKDTEEVISVASHIWELTNKPDDPILWDTVKQYLSDADEWELDEINLEFVDAVWLRAGGNDSDIAFNLALAYFNKEDVRSTRRGASILLTLIANLNGNEKIILKSLDLLKNAKIWNEASIILEKYKNLLNSSNEFLVAWAELLIDNGDINYILHALHDPDFRFNYLTTQHTHLAAAILLSVDEEAEAQKLMEIALKSGIQERSISKLAFISKLFDRVGRSTYFREIITKSFPDRDAERLLLQIDRSLSGRKRRVEHTLFYE